MYNDQKDQKMEWVVEALERVAILRKEARERARILESEKRRMRLKGAKSRVRDALLDSLKV